MDHQINEPASLPDDTKPRPAVDAGDSKPVEISEPAHSPDDTEPRAAVVKPEPAIVEPPRAAVVEPEPAIVEPPRAAGDTEPRPAEQAAQPDQEEEAEPRSGCGNSLLVGAVLVAFTLLCLVTVGLAAYAGWRDGSADFQAHKAATLGAVIDAQVTLARGDCDNGRYELCNVRCMYVATAQPFYPGMTACMSAAQLAMSATPSPTPTLTPTPVTPTPTLTPTPASSPGAFSMDDLFIRAKEAIRTTDYETAMPLLEALRGLNADYHRQEVESMLAQTYEALGSRYLNEARLNEMIIVMKKALALGVPLTRNDWEFTINAAQLYQDAKGYLVTGDIKSADTVYNKLMSMAPQFMDTTALACQAFAKAGDNTALKQYKCP